MKSFDFPFSKNITDSFPTPNKVYDNIITNAFFQNVWLKADGSNLLCHLMATQHMILQNARHNMK